MEEAVEFLMVTLASGPVPAKKLEAMAKEQGIAIGTLNRARKQLGVQSKRVQSS